MPTNNRQGQRFTELARAKVSDSRDVVISKTQSGTVLMAQQLKVSEGKSVHNIFLKGAIEVQSLEGLYELRDAVNMAIASFGQAHDQF